MLTPNLHLFTTWIKDEILPLDASQFTVKIKEKADKLGITPIELVGFVKLSLNKTKDPQRLELLKAFIEKAREAKTIKEAASAVPVAEPALTPEEPSPDLDMSSNEKNVDPLAGSVDTMTNKFPKLKETLVELLTGEYKTFIKDIYWIAPRPTTFKVILMNDQYFYLMWYKLTFIAQISGKKFYLLNINEEQRAVKAIAELLRLSGSNLAAPQSSELKSDKKEKTPLPFEPEADDLSNSEPNPENSLGK